MAQPHLNGTATLDELRREHRLLDAEIDHIENGPGLASPQLKELKKKAP